MLTAFAITYYLSEAALTSGNGIQGLFFLIILAAIIDFGIWTLGES